MKSHHFGVALALLVGATVLPAALTAQQQQSTRYRGMDANRDGVITRAEWRGNDQSFRQQDRNNDGVLTAAEIDATSNDRYDDRDDNRDGVNDGYGLAGDFSRVDLDGNGHVTSQEWRRAFTQLDDNRDGSLTQDELRMRNNRDRTPAPAVTRAFQSGRDRGMVDGRQAGREDGQRRVWDLDGQQELERADAGYRSDVGARDQYQAGYREGFRQGYAEGYGARR